MKKIQLAVDAVLNRKDATRDSVAVLEGICCTYTGGVIPETVIVRQYLWWESYSDVS
jgi:hypothetical protein